MALRPAAFSGPAARLLSPLVVLLLALLAARPATAAPEDDYIASFMPALRARTLTCVRYTANEDGFVRFKNQAAAAAALSKVPEGQTVPLDPDDLVGYNVDTIRWLATKATEKFNATLKLEYVFYQLPANLTREFSITDPEILEHVTKDMGFECLMESLQVKTERAAAVNYMQSNMPFGYIMVTPGPKPRKTELKDTMLNFLRPFTWQVWVTIIGLWVVTSAAILLYENPEEYGEFGDRATRRRAGHSFNSMNGRQAARPKGYKSGMGSHTWVNKFGYASFSSWLTFTSGHFITPVSAAGRLLTMVVCFVCLGLVAAYTANLATIFTTAALPVQTVNNLADLVSKGAKLCIKDSKTHIKFFAKAYPMVKLEIVKGEEPQVLEAIADDRCLAGASSNAHMAYFLSTNASWCDLKFAGQALNFGYYSMAFHKKRAMAPVVTALNVLLDDAIEKNELQQFQMVHFPSPERRDLCNTGKDDAVDDSGLSLSIEQVAGLFMVAAGTLVLCTLLHFTVDSWRRQRELMDNPDLAEVVMAASDEPSISGSAKAAATVEAPRGRPFGAAWGPGRAKAAPGGGDLH